MLPRKTDLARTALQAHRAPLDMRQRRLLILCDGQRDLAALSTMIGPEAPAMVIQLIQAGYLVTTAEAVATPAADPAAARSDRAPPDLPANAAAPAPAALANGRRRSMAAARIYLLGILELQRHPRAAALFRELQQARQDSEVIEVMQTALDALTRLTSPGYTDRVHGRLVEALPLEHLGAFEKTPEKGTEGIKSHPAVPELT